MMTSWIQGVPPVPAAKEVLASTGYEDLADSQLIFPDEETYAKLHEYRSLTPEEQQEFDDLFLPIYLN